MSLEALVAPSAAARPVRIAIDMDEVIVDLLPKLLRVYNEAFGERLTRDQISGCSLDEAVPDARRAAARALIDEPSFFADPEPMPGSIEVVRELCQRYDVFIASAAMEVPTSLAAKFQWLQRHLPFIPPSHLVFCGDKGIVDADFLIDDTPRHFLKFRGTGILFDAPHNRRIEGYRRVRDWADVRRLFLEDSPRLTSLVT
jgi:5'(3')-deoxyribonucleotidase